MNLSKTSKIPEIKLLTKVVNAVLSIEATEIENELDGSFDPCIRIHYKNIYDEDFGTGVLLLNIYEFVALCRKWIYKNGFGVNIDYSYRGRPDDIKCSLSDSPYPESAFYDNAENELEVILKACNWVLENKKDRNEK